MSDGTCTNVAPMPVDPLCTQTLTDGGTITVNYDTTNDQVVMQAILPDGSYAGWGWGPDMGSATTSTEMVIFSANGASSTITTYQGVGEQPPVSEPSMQSCYTTSTKVLADGSIQFDASRPLDCGVA